MKKTLCLTLAALSLSLPVFAQKPGSAVAVYQLPEAKRVKLPNGLVILLLEQHELPLTAITVALRSGTLQDPEGKPGVSAFTEELLRRGTQNGDQTKSAEQIATEIDFIGMQFGGGGGGRGGGGGGAASYDTTDISGDFLAKDSDKALAIVADVILHPTFPADELKKAIAQRQERLKTSKDDAQTAVSQYFLATLYAGHPYSKGLSTSEASLDSITRDDIVAFYKRVYTPANAVISVVGDFKSAEMEKKLTTLFGDWKGAAPAPVTVPVLKPVTGRHVVLVDKPDATQTYFIIGNVGISESDPDRAPIRVVNLLFGGRFTSIFNDELRIKSGYTYGASSRFEEFRTPGPFVMSTYTRNATTEPAIDLSLDVLGRIHTHPFTDDSLTSAKNYIRGTFPPTLETGPELARRLATNEVEGISREKFNAELAQEQATTLADANKVIDKDFPTKDNYVMVIVGKASEIGAMASKYGTVTTKKISDPGY